MMTQERQIAMKPAARAGPRTNFGMLQRKCACGGPAGPSGECEECKQNGMGLQRRAGGAAAPPAVPPIVHEALRSPGQPLDAATRAFMEPRFGHDFSKVRLHTDARAAESARAVNALAYTVGSDIVFGTGQSFSGEGGGRRLLAHELSHVIQQSGETQGNLTVNEPGDVYEQEADRVADQVSTIDTTLFCRRERRISRIRLMRSDRRFAFA